MASSPSRIPVLTQHPRIPVVLGSALPPVASSRMSSSASMPSVAVRAVSHTSADTAAAVASTSSSPTSQSGTSGSGGFNAASSMRHDAVAEDEAWGKIERLRTRRVFSEGHNQAGPSFSAGSSSRITSPAKPDRQLDINHIREGQSSVSSPFEPLATSELMRPRTERSKGSSGSAYRLPDIRLDSGHVEIQDQLTSRRRSDSKPVHRSSSIPRAVDGHRNQTLRRNPLINNDTLARESHVGTSTQAGQVEYATKSHLVRNDGRHATSLLALGFPDVVKTPNGSTNQQLVYPLGRDAQIPDNQKANMARPIDIVGGDNDSSRWRTEGEGHGQSKRSADQIPRILASSHDTIPSKVNMAGRVSGSPLEIDLNSPEMSISLDTQDSGYSLGPTYEPNQTVTTAQKRHQPQLRLASMPNVPMFHAPGVELPSRSPGSGGSPPIPAKNPLRKRSSVGTVTPGSQVSTPGLSGRPTFNMTYGSPAESVEINSQHAAVQSSNPTVRPPRVASQATARQLENGLHQVNSQSDTGTFPARSNSHGEDRNAARAGDAQQLAKSTDTRRSEVSRSGISVSLSCDTAGSARLIGACHLFPALISTGSTFQASA